MTPTLVLDTNAWLDLLVFDDPALRGVEADAAAGRVVIVSDARALDELARVLAYPTLALSLQTQSDLLAIANAHTRVVVCTPRALPRCRDPDDQKFLEIAVESGADALLTRDDALLRLAARMAREHAVAIRTPAAWRAARDQMSKR